MCTACSCTADTDTTAEVAAAGGEVSQHQVTGMTCGHCVTSVTEQIQRIDGVRDVAVDLGTGTVTVTAGRPVSAHAIATAVREAGYQVV